MNKKKILFLCGGKSEEHEISLISVKGLLDALDTSRFEPLLVGIAKSGAWYLQDPSSYFLGDFRADKIKLNENRPSVAIWPSKKGSQGCIIADGREYFFDAVFPILHGQFGEDGTIQGLFELVGTPFVGSGCRASALCMDKVLTKKIAQQSGIAVAPFCEVTHVDQIGDNQKLIDALDFPLFVKPSSQGSSVGVSKVTQPSQLKEAVQSALKYDSACLIEKGIQGREIEISVLGPTHSPETSLPGEIIPDEKIGWYSYEAKYLLADGAQTVVPALIKESQLKEIQALAKRAFTALGCRGMARVDMFLEHGTNKVYLNEINTLPGFTPISMYPKMWEASGLSYRELVSRLINIALDT